MSAFEVTVYKHLSPCPAKGGFPSTLVAQHSWEPLKLGVRVSRWPTGQILHGFQDISLLSPFGDRSLTLLCFGACGLVLRLGYFPSILEALSAVVIFHGKHPFLLSTLSLHLNHPASLHGKYHKDAEGALQTFNVSLDVSLPSLCYHLQETSPHPVPQSSHHRLGDIALSSWNFCCGAWEKLPILRPCSLHLWVPGGDSLFGKPASFMNSCSIYHPVDAMRFYYLYFWSFFLAFLWNLPIILGRATVLSSVRVLLVFLQPLRSHASLMVSYHPLPLTCPQSLWA